MPKATFAGVQPILGTRDLAQAVRFYVDRLGFTLAFGDPSVPINYVGLRRDNVKLHLQFQFEHEMQTTRLRLVVDDPDALYEEYQDQDVFHEGTRGRHALGNSRVRTPRSRPKCSHLLSAPEKARPEFMN